MPMRPPSSVCIATRNPPCSSPRRFSRGTRTSVSASCAECAPRTPIFSSTRRTSQPAHAVSTMNAPRPLFSSDGSRDANTIASWASGAFVMKFFVPFST
jgi:hypothetical protein